MKTTSIKAAALILAVGIPAVFASTVAQADDQKVYPATMCDKFGTNGILVERNGSLENKSTTESLMLRCPLVRDSHKPIASGEVLVADLTTRATVSCTLKSVHRAPDSGRAIEQTLTRTSGAPSIIDSGVTNLRFPAMNTSPAAHYYFDCTLPPAMSTSVANRSRLHSYMLTEKE
ncbi:MAG: hypothetical protein WBM66_07365 [Thiothrix litoralis]